MIKVHGYLLRFLQPLMIQLRVKLKMSTLPSPT